jgi:hypothetical protein
MHVVFYVLFLNKFNVFEPLAKFKSLKECKKTEISLMYHKKKNFSCDQLRDEHLSKPFDYFYFLEIPYCDEKGYCQFE